MTSPAAIPAFVGLAPAAVPAQVWRGSLRAMASDITVLIGDAGVVREQALDSVARVFAQVEAECTRFDARSDLMRANAAGNDWCAVGPYCFMAIEEAGTAYRATAGLFDPRILGTLRRLGYVGSVAFGVGALELTGVADPEPDPVARAQWIPGFDADARAVRVGPIPIDLGGIGKGLAIRWAAEQIAPYCAEFVIDAGGDCVLRGNGPDAEGWHVGIEDPRGGGVPVVVLALGDSGCATSSIRLRKWTVGGKAVHHLIDPRTGAPGGAGLLSVTVIGPDPATDEIWSKVLFLNGRDGIARAAAERGLAAIWIHDDGGVAMSDAARPFVIWQAV